MKPDTSPLVETKKSTLHRIWNFVEILSSMVVAALLLIPLFFLNTPWPTIARDHLQSFGIAESGAFNTVSAIYLGYRLFDTLGETIVLLVAVSGTIGIIAASGASLAKGFTGQEGSHSLVSHQTSFGKHHRTELLEVVTGKLGPIVLMFGFYVMLYGHVSPGGGFQGGVVIASGIIFLALGGREGAQAKLTEPQVLARIEAMAFLLVLSGSIISLGLRHFFDPTGQIVMLNSVIGLKVGAGIGFMGIAMLSKQQDSP